MDELRLHLNRPLTADDLAAGGSGWMLKRWDADSEAIRASASDAGMSIQFGGHQLPALLPRELFASNPEWFPMRNGVRDARYNLCISTSYPRRGGTCWTSRTSPLRRCAPRWESCQRPPPCWGLYERIRGLGGDELAGEVRPAELVWHVVAHLAGRTAAWELSLRGEDSESKAGHIAAATAHLDWLDEWERSANSPAYANLSRRMLSGMRYLTRAFA